MPLHGTEYRTLNKNIRKICRQAYNERLNEKYANIEWMIMIDVADIFLKIVK